MSYTLPTTEDISESVVVRQDTTLATIYQHKLALIEVNWKDNILRVVDQRVEQTTDRIVETIPHIFRLLSEPEITTDPVVAGDVGLAMGRLLNKRIYAILERKGLVTAGGTVGDP